jgi:hypothetical protein
MSWLLLRLMQRVVQVRVGSEWAVMLILVLLKKGTKLLASLGKYMHDSKNVIGLGVAAHDQARFFKTTDYHKICELIDKEIAVQWKQLDIAIESVYVSKVGLLKLEDFSREFKEEMTNQPFFEKCIIEFLREAVKTELSAWFQLTDKIQDALFMCTHIKSATVLQAQRKPEAIAVVCGNEKGSVSEGSLAKKKSIGLGFSLFSAQVNDKWKEYWSRNMEREPNGKVYLKICSKVMGVTEDP